MRCRLIITAGVMALTVLLITEGASQDRADVVTVGAILPVTGNSSFIGSAERNTLSWLVEDYNAAAGAAGRKIKLVVHDSAGDPTRAVNFARRLIQTDRASVIVGPGTSGESLAVRDLVAGARIPMLSLASSHRIVEPVNPWIFKVAQSDSLAVERIYDYLAGRNLRRVAILTAEDGFGASGRDELKRLAGARRGFVIAFDETFALDRGDLTPQLKRVGASGAEAVIVWGIGPEPATITKRMRELGMKQLLVQSHGAATGEFIRLAGPAANGVVLPAGKLVVAGSLLSNDPQRGVLMEFANGYRGRYKTMANTFAGHAWDAFHLLRESFRKGRYSPGQIRADLEARKGFVGVTGVFTFSPEDHAGLTREAFVDVQIENGDWKLIR